MSRAKPCSAEEFFTALTPEILPSLRNRLFRFETRVRAPVPLFASRAAAHLVHSNLGREPGRNVLRRVPRPGYGFRGLLGRGEEDGP